MYVCLYVWLYVFLAVWPTYLILTCVAPTLACLTRMARSPRCHTTIFVCCRSTFANRFLTLGRVCKYNMCPPTLTCLLCSSPSCWPQQAMWLWPDQSNDDVVCFGASEQKSETSGSGQENRLFLHCRSSLELGCWETCAETSSKSSSAISQSSGLKEMFRRGMRWRKSGRVKVGRWNERVPAKKVWCSGLGFCLEMSLIFDVGHGLRCGLSIRHCRCHWIMAAWFVFLHFFLVPLCWYAVSERQMLLFLREV